MADVRMRQKDAIEWSTTSMEMGEQRGMIELVFIPQPLCTRCQSDALEWVESTGRGTVYSHTVVHRPPRPAFAVPYVVAIVELDEGWHMLTNLIDCRPEEVCVGMPVEVAFRPASEAITLPYFRPRA